MNISFVKLGHEECEQCESFQKHNANHVKSADNLIEYCDCDNCKVQQQHVWKGKASCEKYRQDASSDKWDVANQVILIKVGQVRINQKMSDAVSLLVLFPIL